MCDWWKDDQALAYAIVEQGRVACERCSCAASPRRASPAGCAAAHNGFGLAGYAASDHLLDGVRAGGARARSTRPARRRSPASPAPSTR